MKREKTMKTIIKNNLKYIIFLAICGLIGGYFTGIYTLQNLSPELLNEALGEVDSVEIVYLVTAIQGLLYAVILGLIGKFLSKKIGLWRKLEFSKKAVTTIILVTILGGIIFIMADHLIFNHFSNIIKNSYETKPTIEYIIASILYGGVVEEVMLRLFFMSLVAVIICKVTKREINDKILILANVTAAILFAAGHLPGTAMMIGITPMIVLRCFLLNGGFGLLFGRLYKKHGIYCAMVAHMGVHIVSKLIWLLFI